MSPPSDPPDHFSAQAAHYARFRPHYPAELFAWLATYAPGRQLAWDVGTGSGQAARALADHFVQVVATDPSATQLAHARPHPAVHYRVGAAEHCGLEPASTDLITIAQALHWFDLDAFYREVRRVARPGALIAAWSYGAVRVDDDSINSRLQRFYAEEVGPYWPPERRHVENGYRDLPFPFTPLSAPDFQMQVRWPLAALVGYMRSWSSTQAFIDTLGFDPTPALAETLADTWGDPNQPRVITWPLSIRAGYVG